MAGSNVSMNAQGPKSMVSPDTAMLSVFMTPWMKPTFIQTGDERGLARHDLLQQRKIGALDLSGAQRIMPIDHIVGEDLRAGDIAPRRKIFKRADTHVARGDSRQMAPGSVVSRCTVSPVRHRRQRPGSRNPQRMHGFTDQIFAQHRTQGRTAIPAARIRSASAAFQLDVAKHARPIARLSDQYRPAVAELRHKMAELMPGIGHGDGNSPLRQDVA